MSEEEKKDNIEVGEYIRTKNGLILKLNENNIVNIFNFDGENVYIDLEEEGLYFEEDKIIKHSKNIIDLIEVNDIVTYWIDTQSYNGWVTNFVDIELLKEMKENFIEEDIKAIVTKERFEEMAYEIN